MQESVIQQIINHFIEAFQKLERDVSLHEIESLATTIHKAMKMSTRSYHTPEHILRLANNSSPAQTLAALFHDIVYYQVDRGFLPEVTDSIAVYIQECDGEIRIRDDIDEGDLPFIVALDIFGFSPGHALSPFDGQNEFLSALFMNRRLSAFLPLKLLAKTSAYIEATIPFRPETEPGRPWTAVLRKRLDALSQKLRLDVTPEELDDTLRSAVDFSNRDLESFSETDIGTFLSGTWNLLPEHNSPLRAESVYSIQEYRQALQNMERFFRFLSPEHIFHCYLNTPPPEEFRQLQQLAQRNVSIAREYLGIKLLAIGIIEALAEVTGGDAPLSLFMGDLKQEGDLPLKRLEDFLPQESESSGGSPDSPVSSLLEAGRSRESSFDIKTSPTSFFLYQRLSPEKRQDFLRLAKEMFHGNLGAKRFLAELDRSVVAGIASACAEMVPTRRDELLCYAETTRGEQK